VNCIIAGGMGPRAQELFNSAGISVVLGVSGSVDNVIKQFLEGTLNERESLCDHGQRHGTGKGECDHHEDKHHVYNEKK